MSVRHRWWWATVWLIVVVGLPLLGHALRHPRTGRCALDGQPIHSAYRVHFVEASGLSLKFCCILCAQRWLDVSPRPREIFVTDEVSGREILAVEACYVRSSVVTQSATGNRVHAFARREDAEIHARQGRGSILSSGARDVFKARSIEP